MVYLDNAATTYPKPPSVISKSSFALVNYGANPGRSGHKLSMETGEAVYEARQRCADFFEAKTENVCFMLNCTEAINTALKGIAEPGCHFITSDWEHNAVLRPLTALSKEDGISFSVARVTDNDNETAMNFARLIKPETKGIICTAASNVSGHILPYKRLAAICKKNNICFILDAAQGAGVLPISLSDGINIICAAGHKGLYGPMGTGLMITDGKYRLKTLIEGGTGSASKEPEQPEFLPDRFESGTINTSGAIALGEGVRFVSEKGVSSIYEHEWQLCSYAFNHLRKNRRVILYGGFTRKNAPLFSFNIVGLSSDDTAARLSDSGFYLRGGFHCAYLAHKKLGTLETGTVRLAPSVYTTKYEVSLFLRAVDKITRGK